MKKLLLIAGIVIFLVVAFLVFRKSSSPQTKVDKRVACESALAYMSFPSSKEADLFVKECIDGKYPEVIERYVKDRSATGNTENSQIANPASVNCVNKGGKLSIVDEPEGQIGMCTLPNRIVCEEWAYFRGECPKG